MSLNSLESLVTSLVPDSRSDSSLKQELIEHVKEVLASHIGSDHEPDTAHLSELVRRHLLQQTPSGTSALRFANLLSRLLDQPILSRKQASVQFLYSLATSSRQSSAPLLVPTLAPPPPGPSKRTPSPSSADLLPAAQKGKAAADVIREYRNRHGQQCLSEALLLRDVLYLLQGISGKYVQLESAEGSDKLTFVEDSKHMISSPTRTLIYRLSEVGYLYIRVERYIKERERKRGVGMIEQSLCHHLQEQLTEYYRIIAALESQMSIRLGDSAHGSLRDQEIGLTLKRLDVWITDWKLRLRMMSVCVQGAQGAHGGALVNLIHSYTHSGDPFVTKFTNQLLEEVSKPFFTTLHRWLFSGELHDPFSEFFVEADPNLAHVQYLHPSSNQLTDGGIGGGIGETDELLAREGGLRLWQNKYRLCRDMLPMFVGESFGKKIFSTGKSLNFIRYSCHDSDWVATREKMSNTGGVLKYSDIAGLERSIDAAYQVASRRLFEVFLDKFRLMDHLKALKHYLMLGHGDFTEQLIDTLGPSLGRAANTLYRHNLTATLETAIRTSNAQNDPPDVLRRLDARMLEYSHGEIGWDVFTLEYKVDAPIDTVLDPDSMIKYLKVFNHLWQMKRVSVALGHGWMRIAGGARTFLRLKDLEYDWHQIRISMMEMVHVIRQMEAYCHLEVIECSWKVLVDFLNKQEGDLDALIEVHGTYLDRIVKKVLLLNTKAGKEEVILNQVKEIFSIILEFREATDSFYNFCLRESARRERELDRNRGIFTGPINDDDNSAANTLSQLRSQLHGYRTLFSERTLAVVHALQSHVDMDCRFLATRLSFSEFYKSKKEMQQLVAKG